MKYGGKTVLKKLAIVMFIVLTLFGAVYLAGYAPPYSSYLGHVSHLFVDREKLYRPLVEDEFAFWRKGATKSYALNPKYFDYYEIGILSIAENIPATYKFGGKVKIEILRNKEMLFETTADEIDGAWFKSQGDGRLEYYKSIGLTYFEIPLKGRYKDLMLRLTVIEPDTSLEEFKDSLRFYVRVSPMP